MVWFVQNTSHPDLHVLPVNAWTDLNCIVFHGSERARNMIVKHEFFNKDFPGLRLRLFLVVDPFVYVNRSSHIYRNCYVYIHARIVPSSFISCEFTQIMYIFIYLFKPLFLKISTQILISILEEGGFYTLNAEIKASLTICHSKPK